MKKTISAKGWDARVKVEMWASEVEQSRARRKKFHRSNNRGETSKERRTFAINHREHTSQVFAANVSAVTGKLHHLRDRAYFAKRSRCNYYRGYPHVDVGQGWFVSSRRIDPCTRHRTDFEISAGYLAYKFVRYRSAHDIGVRIFNARMQVVAGRYYVWLLPIWLSMSMTSKL